MNDVRIALVLWLLAAAVIAAVLLIVTVVVRLVVKVTSDIRTLPPIG